MHDIRAIRDTPAAFDAGLARRGDAPLSATLLAQDEARRGKITAAETAQAEQNKASKLVGAAKASGDEAEFSRLRALVSKKKAEVDYSLITFGYFSMCKTLFLFFRVKNR